MSWLAIGHKGGPIRMFTRNPAQARGQLQAGEVVVPSDNDMAVSISADGLTVLNAVTSLAELKAARWSEAKTVRDTVAAGGCSTPLGRVQTDAASYQRILGAMIAAQNDTMYSVEWTMADNSIMEHDAAAVISMGLAVTEFLNACQSVGETIRATIEAATDADALASVDVAAGYPD